MGCKLECGLVTLCHGGSRGPFWPKHVVANMFMPQDSAFRHPHCEKCGLTLDSLGQGVSATRNNMMLRILEDITAAGERQAVCENRGSGVGAMKDALLQADL